jgi:hypothetical protein
MKARLIHTFNNPKVRRAFVLPVLFEVQVHHSSSRGFLLFYMVLSY